jgi:O-antigen/teichoic acid export membrane protein
LAPDQRVYHLLRIDWRGHGGFAKHGRLYCVEAEMSPESLQNVLALALGFAVAGLCSSGYQLITSRLPSFGLLSAGPSPSTFAAVPVLMLAAPFLIMRNTLLGYQQEGRRFEFVFLATLIAGFWSLMSGLVLVQTLQACGFLHA